MDIAIISDSESSLARQAREVAALLHLEFCVVAALPDSDVPVFLAVDDVVKRERLLAQVPVNRRINLVHPAAWVSDSAQLGHNIYIGAQSVVAMQASVGDGVVQNALSSIEHDNVIGKFTMLGTGAILCGGVVTGERAFIGGGATIKPGVSIGAGATIGSGTVVIDDVESDSVYVGNPARRIKG